MSIGLFAKALPRPTLADTCAAVRALGCDTVQFNLSCVGVPTLPAHLDAAVCDQIAHTVRQHGITMAALSATGNLIQPDPIQRQAVHAGIATLIRASARVGTQLLTIATGTCHPHDMWQAHADNATPASWHALLDALAGLLPLAEAHGVTLAFEPEQGNVVRTVAQARALLDTCASPALAVVLDVANLLNVATMNQQMQVIDEAFGLRAADMTLIHLKERAPDGTSGHLVPGQGVIDYRYLWHVSARAGVRVPMVMHELPRALVAPTVRWWHQLGE
ncbi:MAG: sugar phosphate isomerase/epimerase family protein [Roseiflexaceae bacterium]